MATSTFTASLYYAANDSSSWTSGAAQQDKYSSTRYTGALAFPISGLNFSNINISEIRLALTFAKSGAAGTSTKILTFYSATGNAVTGKPSARRGAQLATFRNTDMYNSAMTIPCDATYQSALFTALRDISPPGRRSC